MGLLSIVIPLYNEEAVLPLLRQRLTEVIDGLSCDVEAILISDGSTDNTNALLLDWAHADKRIRVVEFSRNFGHQAAITAGMDLSSGDGVVVMDGDLQDPPELLTTMVEHFERGYDVIFAQRSDRTRDSWLKRATASLFYSLMGRFVLKNLPRHVGDFRLMSRDFVEAISQFREGHRFIRGMTVWAGFKQISIPMTRPERPAGTTKFPIRKMMRFALDAILSFSGLPLRLAMFFGAFICLFGFGAGGYFIVRRLLSSELVPGWTSLFALISIVGGTTLMSIGIVGEYIARIYEEVKGRPLYIVKRMTNFTSYRARPRTILPTSDTRRVSPRAKKAA